MSCICQNCGEEYKVDIIVSNDVRTKMRRCEDCINYKKNRPFGEWCKSKRRKQRVWPCAEKCSEYVPKWWKFWLYLFKIS